MSRRRRAPHRLLLLALAGLVSALSAGCGDAALSGGPAGEFGATAGGVQDMRLARELVEQGQVPPPEAFVVEGMFSEHDLPLQGAGCSEVLCLRGAGGIADDLDGERRGFVQIGMSSTINPDTYVRPSVALIAVVDVSGSMGYGYGTGVPKDMSEALLHDMAEQLGADDRFALVQFGSTVRTNLSLVGGDDQEAIHDAIDALEEDGSTNMEAGLAHGFHIARQALGQTDDVRVVLFTDVQPNVGATSASDFEQLVKSGADEGIGTTIIAAGVGIGAEVMNAMAKLKSANAFGLIEPDDVDRVMDESFPYLLSPIAHALRVEVDTSDDTQIGASYGFPGDADGVLLEVASVFLSKKRGGVLLRIDGLSGAGFKVAGALSFEDRHGMTHTEDLDVEMSEADLEDGAFDFAQPSVHKTTALALLVEAMKHAADVYPSDPEAAAARVDLALDRITADQAALDDEALLVEVAFADALLTLINEGAPQGNLYGQY